MYIVCHKCAATYSVDERLLTARARTQCPNCLQVQSLDDEPTPAVKFEEATVVGSPPPAAAQASAFRIPSIAPVSAPPVRSEPAINDSLLTGGAQRPERVATHCRDCGAPLADAFDRALGICENCRTNAPRSARGSSEALTQRDMGPRASPTDGAARAVHWDHRGDDVELEEMPDPFVEAEPVAVDSEDFSQSVFEHDAGLGTDVLPETHYDAEENRAHIPELYDPSELLNAEVPHSRWRGGRTLGVVAVVAVVIVGAALLLTRRRAPSRPARAPVAVRLPEPWESIRARWSPKFPNLADDPLKLLKQGEFELARDSSGSYAEAEKNFQQVFLLEPESDSAIAGYVEAACLGRGSTMDDHEYRDVSGWIEAAEKRSQRAPRVLIAHATLLLQRPTGSAADRARALSEEALGSAIGKEKAVAYLALGRAFLPTSAELAIQNIDQALKLDPLLRRGYYYRAVARETVGDYRGAIADLVKRLSMDADQSDAVGVLARMYQEAGDSAKAQQVYAQAQQKSPGDIRAAMGRAVIAYQSERKAEDAIAILSELLRERNKYRPDELLEVLVHLATAQRLAGRAEAAAHSADEALKVSQRDAAAHLQLFLLALDRAAPSEAAAHLPYLKQRLDDTGLEKLLEGRLLLAQANSAEAAKRFAQSAESDRRRVDALLLAGAAAATAGQRDAAFQYLVKAGQMDPTRPGPQQLSTRFYVRSEDLLGGAEGRVIRLATGPLDVAPRLYEGLIRFHQRDFAAADKLLRQVLDVDVGNALAYSLRALISLQHNALPAAKTSAERAVRAGRSVALAHYAFGAVLSRAGAMEHAQRELREAELLAPTILATQVVLAEVEARSKDVSAARSRLVHVLRVDPTYLPAKRALFSLER